MSLHENVVLIGAGSAAFTRGLLCDMVSSGWTGELHLVDTNPQARDVAEGLARKMVNAAGSPLQVSATTDRTQALPGATAVISTIGVGGRRAWERDVLVPRRHGIYQPVGDTVGPGGTSRALRMVPAMVEIARDVQKLAPGAFFFNYANPMSVICRAVWQATGAPVVGLCHGVPHSARDLARRLDVPPENFGYTAAGINHLTWLRDLRADGCDLMPRLRELARDMAGRVPQADAFGMMPWLEPDAAPQQEEPFTWRLANLFGLYPVPGDRHVAEFFGRTFAGEGGYYGKTMGVDAFTFKGVIAAGDRAYAEMRRLALSDEPLPEDFFGPQTGEHEQVAGIIESIRADCGMVCSANLPNAGQVPNLPRDAVVECTALADATGVRPVMQRPLPPGVAGTLATRFQWVETVVEAALEGNPEKFVQALLLDGMVESIDQARNLAEDLLAAQGEHLPHFE